MERLKGKTLTNSTHLRQLIPLILKEEIQLIIEESKGNSLMVIFDGTTKVGEVFAIVFRWVTSNLEIIKRLVDVGKYTYSFRTEELVAAVVSILNRYGVFKGTKPPNKLNGNVIAFQRDRVAVNSAAVAILLRNYINSKDMGCLSHTYTSSSWRKIRSTFFVKI